MAKRIGELSIKELKERIQRLVDFRTCEKDKHGGSEFTVPMESILRTYRRRLKKLISQKGK